MAEEKSPKAATKALVDLLEKHGRMKVLPKVFHSLSRALQHAHTTPRTTVTVAHEKDAGHAKKVSGLHDAAVKVDETLVGGWRAYSENTLTDASYKKQLQDLYKRATA